VGYDIFFCKLKKYSFHLQAHKITALHHRQCKNLYKSNTKQNNKKGILNKITKNQNVKNLWYTVQYSTTNMSMERWNHEYINNILKSPIKYSSAKITDSLRKGVSSKQK
jgi:hypothetical protein